MAIYNVNQNRQFYVAKKFNSIPESGKGVEPVDEGDLSLFAVSKNGEKQIFFKHKGRAGLTRTDLIDVDKICYAKMTKNTAMQRKLKRATVTLDPDINGGLPIPGQDYILRLQINNFFSPGDASVYIKSNAVRATKEMNGNALLFYKAMVKSLKNNFSRETQATGLELLNFEVATDGAGITISETKNQPWRLGVLSQETINFEVIPTTIRNDGEDVVWGTVTWDTVKDSEGVEEYIGNGTQIADLEYFCQAERGDMFRNMGWPNNIDVKYMVDSSKEYHVLDIHYYYSGNGVQSHKSEKDITIVSESFETMTALISGLTNFGITVELKEETSE